MSLRTPIQPSDGLALALLAFALAGCATGPQQPAGAAAGRAGAAVPPAFPPQDIVGRWGLAAYHKEEDRERIEAAAANQCKQPYVITLGPTGGVMMHLADQATPTELRLKGAPGGKTYIGPKDEPPGSEQDREVVSFDGRVLILRWMDPGSAGPLRHHGLCALRAGRRQAAGSGKPRPSRKPKPKPSRTASRRPQQSRDLSRHPAARDQQQ